MANVSFNPANASKPAPKWFRKFKKIYTNTENAAVVILLSMGHTESSFLLVCIKTGSSLLLENMETLLANGDDYVSNQQN